MTTALALQRAAGGTMFTFLMTALGAATVFLPGLGARRDGKAMLGFAGGVMTAASVWSLLLPAIERAADGTLPAWLVTAAGTALGAAVLALLDALLAGQGSEYGAAQRRDLLLAGAITLHNIPEGMAVGLACALAADADALALAAALALGIGIQNFPEGAAIALPLRRSGQSRGRAFLAGTLSGVVEPLFGVAAVLAASGVSGLMPWLLSFAAGAMLYVTVGELIPAAQGRRGTLGFLAGFLLMMVLDVALG